MSTLDPTMPYPSTRPLVFGRNMVATSQPLAAEAGLQMLRKGGNAVDAALAAAICLTVVEPTGTGIGSDLFAIVWDGAELHGLNASGRAPAALTPERFAGMEQVPRFGWDPVTVPGAVSGWVELARRFGSLPFEQLFEPAVKHADKSISICPKREFHQNRCMVIRIRTDQRAMRALNTSRANSPVKRRTMRPDTTEGIRAVKGVTSPVMEDAAAIIQNNSGGFSL